MHMERESVERKRRGLLAAVAAVALTCAASVCAFVAPTSAFAAESVAHSVDASGGTTSYYTVDEALSAGYDGKTIYMDADWVVDGITIEEGQSLTLDMYGHKIACAKSDANQVIFVDKGATLTLTSTRKAEFWYRDFHFDDGSSGYTLTTTGGLITSNDQQDIEAMQFSGITLQEKATVTLDGVTISGCYGRDQTSDELVGAGVTLNRSSTLNMINGASISGNKSRCHGAGVCIPKSDATVNMDNSSITNNYAEGHGGGIFSEGFRVAINMNNNSKINNNTAHAGGGVYFLTSNFTFKSDDGKAEVSGNYAYGSSRTSVKWMQSGGGLHVTGTIGDTANALVENITISDNRSDYDAGGVQLDFKNITLRNCKIINNTCKYEGGGVYVCDNGDTIDGCTITGNACSVNSGGNYEGGGVFVWHSYDIKLTGACVIKDNTRGKDSGNADDVFLREDFWTSTKAYITGNLSKGSSVGVRTGITGDRRIAKNFTSDTKDSLFIDLGGYYVSYGSDDWGDAWQRHRQLEYLLKVNGSGSNRYKDGTTVSVSGASKDSSKVFWYWDDKSASGLNPVSDYINDQTKYNSVLTFKMPQNDASVNAVYTTATKKVKLAVAAPVAGEALPTTAEVSSATDSSLKATVPVTWQVAGSDAAASGVAKPETTYVATVSCTNLQKAGIVFDSSIGKDDVTLTGESGAEVKSASYDATTGSFVVTAGDFTTGTSQTEVVDGGTATIPAENGGLAIGGGEAANTASAVALTDGASTQANRPSLGDFSVSYTQGVDEITVVAPVKAGYNFCNWDNAEADWDKDDVAGTVTVPFSDLDKLNDLVAVYTPVVTKVEVGLSAPEAGEGLDTAATKLLLKASDGEQIELVEQVGSNLPVVWSPEALTSGAADFSTAYSALVKIADGDGFVDVDKVLAANADVTVSDGKNAASADFAIVDNKLCLALSFDETRSVKATAVSTPKDVKLTFAEAQTCASRDSWTLPKTVDLTLENGETAEGDITWEAVEGFDANATTAQEFQVKGKVTHVAYDDAVDQNGLSYDVVVTVKVAAPDDGSDDSGKKDDDTTKPDTEKEDGTNDNAGTDNADTAAKKASPATGDATSPVVPAALLAVAAGCLAVARVSRRER